jgi:hypothetical protein
MRGISIRSAAGAVFASAAVLAVGATGAYAASPFEIAYEASGHSEQTWVVNSNGTGRKYLGTGEQPLVSPNGQMVAASNFGSHGQALIVYSTVGKPKQLYINLAQTAATALAWSPDSRYVAVQLTDTTPSSTATNPGAGGVAIVDTTARTVKRIAPGFVFGASFEPTANATDRLAYGLSGSQRLNSPTEIYTINADGTGRTQITHGRRSLNPVWGRLVEGLVPLAFSGNGRRMIAEFEGQDTSEGYTVSVTTHKAKLIKVAHHNSVNADGISRSGNTLLVTLDAFENPTAEGKVATIPFSSGHPKVLATHAGFGTWNG